MFYKAITIQRVWYHCKDKWIDEIKRTDPRVPEHLIYDKGDQSRGVEYLISNKRCRINWFTTLENK